MSGRLTEREWQLLRWHFGDMAYECPDQHELWLATLDMPRLVVDNTCNPASDGLSKPTATLPPRELPRLVVDNTL